MDLRHLKYFHAVAEELHFGRAASRLYVDPSSISKTIQHLENHLGIRLFYRNSSSVVLTKQGSVFLDDTRDILSSLERAKERVRNIDKRERKLRIAVSFFTDINRLSDLLKLFKDACELDISIEQKKTNELVSGLAHGNYDLGLSYCSGSSYLHVQKTKIWSNRLVLLLSQEHQLATSKKLSLHDIAPFSLICLDKQWTLQQQILRLLESNAPLLPKIQYVKTYDLLLTLLTVGNGVGLVPEHLYQNMPHNQIVMRPIKDTRPINTYIFAMSQSEIVRTCWEIAINFDKYET